MDELVIDVSGLLIERDGTFAVAGVDWRVRAGEHWAIVGPNGAGKTSVLRALMGYFSGRGDIALLGRRYGEVDWRAHRAAVGLVTSALLAAIPPAEPAWRTVASGLRAELGTWTEPTPEEEAAARAGLAEVGCEALAERRWQVLSQGERQRVLVARALIAEPRVLVLDEACGGLDLVARERLLALVAALAARPDAPTLVMVTHHVEELGPHFTHALVLGRGRVVAAGPIAEVLTPAVLTAAFEAPIAVARRDGRWAARLAP